MIWENQFRQYQSIVSQSRLSLLEYALNFVMDIPQIDKILVGVTSESQLKEIVHAVKNLRNLKAYPVDDINLLNPSLWTK
jgi:aryl-alcohol dehydrogenase-like predicted oxidoreductase